MKRIYTEPRTDVAMMAMAMTICRVSADGNVPVNQEELTGIKII